MTPSPQQSAVTAFALTGTGSCNVIARAGCGKTSLLIHMVNAITYATPRLKIFLGAFNKSIAEELQSRIPHYNVAVSTMHKAGLTAFRTLRPDFEINGNKIRTLARRHHQYDKKSTGVVVQAVSFAKQSGVGVPGFNLNPADAALWTKIIEDRELDEEIPSDVSHERIIKSCTMVYEESIRQASAGHAVIDFDDMLLMPLMLAGNEDQFRKYDWVMIDELQDQNHVRRVLVERLMLKGGRFCGVGDPAQAIYGFAGADSDSMELTKKYMQCVDFPLNVTYRCPQAVVRLAQTWVKDFTAHESNPEGAVSAMPHARFWCQEFDAERDVILCRNRRPLVGIAKRLRAAGVPCVVEGANGKGLIALAEKWGDDITIEQLTTLLTEYRVKEMKKHMDNGKEEKAEAVSDRVDILYDLMEGLQDGDSVQSLVRRIEETFDDSGSSALLKLCTVHRAKGREWERVFLIGRNAYMPSYYAEKSGNKEAMQQERNLMYVAVTRAKKELIDVCVPKKVRGKGRVEEAEADWWEL